MPLIYLCCAWVIGILLGSEFNLSSCLIFTGLIPLPLLLFARRYRKLVILTSLCLIALFGGVIRFQSSLPSLRFYNDQGIVGIKGIVDRDPEVGDKSTRLCLSVEEIRLGKEWWGVSGSALLFVPRYPTYSYGDVLVATGELETPSLVQEEICSTMFYPEIEIRERGGGFKSLEWIYSLRNRLSQTLAKVLSEPQASLAQAIILGKRGNIPSSVQSDFSHTGTAHILAISGLNLSIVAGILSSIGIWFLGRKHYIYIWLALGTIWLYALLTGMNPPVVRSAIMTSMFLIAELLGRQRSAVVALAFAAAIMVGISPQILRDASFQLSFLAVTGLIFIFPSLQAIGRKAIKATLGEEGTAVSVASITVDSFSVSLGAIIAVWPVIAYYFSIVSFVAPLATFLTLPALPVTIITGALAGGLGFVFLPIAQAIGWLAWLFLSYMLLVIRVLAAFPLSSIELGSVNTTLIWIYYLALVMLIWLSSNQKKLSNPITKVTGWLRLGIDKSSGFISQLPKKWLIPPLLVVAILVSLTAVTMPDNNLHLSVLDVGQGDAILIRKGNQQILVDGGPSPQAICLGLGNKMPFWDRVIDLVILTHPDTDHVTGLVEVLSRYRVGQVLYPDLDYDSTMYNEWLRAIKEKDIQYVLAQAGQQINLAGVTIEALNPSLPLLTDAGSEIDNNGVVLRISMGKVSFLLTADIGQEAEFERINRRAKLNSTVLKVAHHGSDTSTCSEFLAVVNPQLAVISVGKDNPFGHPSDKLMDRLTARLGQENIYRTDEHGTIEFITDGERLWVKTNN